MGRDLQSIASFDTQTCKYVATENKENSGSCGRNSCICSSSCSTGVRSSSGGSSPSTKGHLGHDLDRLVSSATFSSTPHRSGRVGLGEYNFAGRCGFSSPLPSFSSFSVASLTHTRTTDCSDGKCKQAIETETEERKASRQTKKTKQREETSFDSPERCEENNKKTPEKKSQASSNSSIDRDVVDKIRRLRIEGKNNEIRLQKIQNIQK